MRILLIEDDIYLCEILQFELERAGYFTDICNNGQDSLAFLTEGIYDLILLDQMLPGLNGTEILKYIRGHQLDIPVIFLTALGETADKIQGLNLGADDYIVKPFDTGELLARIQSILRRPGTLCPDQRLIYHNFTYDPARGCLETDAGTFQFTRKEGALLEIFMQHPGTTIPRNRLLTRIWGPYAEIEDSNLDNYIYLLRRRLRSIPGGLMIRTIRGIGYRLEISHV